MSNTNRIIVAVIILLIIVGGVYYFDQQKKKALILQNSQEQIKGVFKGEGFSFTYPDKFIADEEGLWTEAGYQTHLNPPVYCETCQIPAIEVIAIKTASTIDQQIISDFGLSGTTLAEMSELDGIEYEQLKIGDNDFIKINVGDMFDVTGYYTKHNNQIIAFKVYWTDSDNDDLRNIMATLKFQ